MARKHVMQKLHPDGDCPARGFDSSRVFAKASIVAPGSFHYELARHSCRPYGTRFHFSALTQD